MTTFQLIIELALLDGYVKYHSLTRIQGAEEIPRNQPLNYLDRPLSELYSQEDPYVVPPLSGWLENGVISLYGLPDYLTNPGVLRTLVHKIANTKDKLAAYVENIIGKPSEDAVFDDLVHAALATETEKARALVMAFSKTHVQITD